VHYIFRLMFRVVRGLTRKPPRYHEPVKALRTEKRRALSGSAVRELVDRLPRAKVVHILDGDTVIVAKQWNKITIRLDSIDCPEARCGQPERQADERHHSEANIV
jgi:endonuclease YncB( thermonuclease family)